MLFKLQEYELINEKKRNAELITEFFSEICSFHIDSFSYYLLDETTRRIQGREKDIDIIAINVFDNEGNKFNPSGISLKDVKIDKKFILISEKDIFSKLSTKREKKIGKVQIIFSLKDLYKSLDKVKFRFFISLFGLILILDLFLITLVFFIIIKPINILTHAVQIIAAGNFSLNIPINSKDELEYLAKSFMKMSKELEKSFESLKKQKESIEEEVKKRTKELDEANKVLLENNKKFKMELAIAQKIQKSIIPEDLKISDYLVINSKYIPAEELGGDYYDFFVLNDKEIGIAIVDVCGHGVPSALIMSMAKIILTNNVYKYKSIETLLKNANRELYNIIGGFDDFITYLTCFYGIINIDTGKFTFVNAAHANIYIINNHNEINVLSSHSLPIGVFENVEYKEETIALSFGDRIVLTTDGLIEYRGKNREIFGEDRLKELIIRNKNKNGKEFIDDIIINLKKFNNDTPQEDDITILIVDYLKY